MLPPKKRLLDQVRDRLRLKNYAYRPEKSYLYIGSNNTSCFTINATRKKWQAQRSNNSGEKAETSTDGTFED